MDSLLINYLSPGLAIGITAALTPGPLMTLIVAESLRGGFRSGAKIAIAPILTDIPFIIAAIILARSMNQSPVLLAVTSFIGAAFLAYLAITNIRVKKNDFQLDTTYKGSVWKGITMNLLNPNMYIWWFSVSTPFFAQGNATGSIMFACALLGSSVLLMIGLAFGVTKLRLHIFDYAHWVLRALSIALVFFALKLFNQGLGFLGH